jgi:multidrug efflux pump subunit AcrB/outer membrane protein TolC
MEKHNIIERLMREYRIVFAILFALVAYGVVAFLTMPRQEFPEFTIRQGLVVGIMPGADAQQVEERLARPVEQYLFSYKEVNKAKTYSTSQDGRAIIIVELNENVHGAEAPAFWAKLRHGLNELRAQSLPAQVLALVGNNDFGDTSALLLTVVADGHSPRDVEKQLRVIENHLRRLPATAKLHRVGEQQEVVRVEIDNHKLARYAIKPETVWLALQGSLNAPAGFRVDSDKLEMPVHVKDVISTEQGLAETILCSLPSGEHIRIKDVATLTREYGHENELVRYNGKTALVLSVEMLQGHDITHYGKEVDAALEAAKRELPPGVEISRVADQPKAVRESVNHFMHDFVTAIVCVIGVTMLLLPLRVASVAAVTIPVSILITLGILQCLGVELQTVSLAGLVLVLGMVVDNAIVVVDDHVERLDHGANPWAAASKSARELFVPILAATGAIIMAYVPNNWFLTGQSADFISSLPLTVAVALIVSLVLAMTLVPILDYAFIKVGLHNHDAEVSAKPKFNFMDLMNKGYGQLLERAFRFPTFVLLGLGVGSVVVSVLLAGRIEQQLFPKVDRDQFAVEVYLPAGRPFRQTDEVVSRLEKILMGDKRVVNVTSFIGTSSPRFHTLYAPEAPNRNYAQLIVNTTSNETAVEVLKEYSHRYDGTFADAWVRWKQLDMQQAKAPIEVRLSGDDISALKQLGEKLKAYARTLPGVTWVRDDYDDARGQVSIIPDHDACARLGVSPAMIQASLALASNTGVPLGTIWEGDYPVRILLAKEPRHLDKIEDLRQAYVSAGFVGAAVPLEQIASVRPALDEGTIVRRNGVRTLSVRADLAVGKVPTQSQEKMERFVASLRPTPGIHITWGGERQDQEEQYPPMMKSLATSVAFIYLILLFQFRRHKKALLVMVTMPLALLGSVVGLVVTGRPFGFTSFVGVISLMGIVVRNGIILVDYAETLRVRDGLSAREAALASGKRRMRPIFLTSAAAAVGVIPMILSGSTLWAPLGAVTAFGLIFSMILTLFVLPVAYWVVMKSEDHNRGDNHHGVTTAGALALIVAFLCLPGNKSEAAEIRLTLDECRELASKQSTDVQAAKLELEAAKQTKAAAYTQYFPKVSANAGILRSGSPLATIPTAGGLLPVLDSSGVPTGSSAYFPEGKTEMAKHVNSASIMVVQPVVAGGRIVNGNRLAEVGVQVASEGIVIAKRDSVAGVEETYWRILQLQEKLRTLTAYEALLEEVQKQADDAAKAGLSTPNDALKVRVQRDKCRVDRSKLESGISLLSRDLLRQIGVQDKSDDTVVLVDGLAEPSQPAQNQAEMTSGVERRPEIHQLQHAVRAEELHTAMLKGEMLPSVGVGVMGMRNRVSGLKDYNDGMAFAVVQVPLSGIWEHSHTSAASRKKERIAEARLRDARRKVQLEISKRWDGVNSSWLSVQAARTTIEQAELNLRELSDQYRNGLQTVSELLEAQVLLQKARNDNIDAKADYWVELSGYRRAVAAQ